jgi:transcription elongation factor Elf1
MILKKERLNLNIKKRNKTMINKFFCAVCGLYSEGTGVIEIFKDRYEETGDEGYICACCGFQPGYSDIDQEYTFNSYRKEWIENGMRWKHDYEVDFPENQKPDNWNPIEQMNNIPIEFQGKDWNSQLELANTISESSKKLPEILKHAIVCQICGYIIDSTKEVDFRSSLACTCCRNLIGVYLLYPNKPNLKKITKQKIIKWIQSGMVWIGSPVSYNPLKQLENISEIYFDSSKDREQILGFAKIAKENRSTIINAFKKYKMCLICGELLSKYHSKSLYPTFYLCSECEINTGFREMPLGVLFRDYCNERRRTYLKNKDKSHEYLINIPDEFLDDFAKEYIKLY